MRADILYYVRADILYYVRADILLTCRKHLHHRIISLRGEDCAHKTSLTPPLFIEVPVPIQEIWN